MWMSGLLIGTDQPAQVNGRCRALASDPTPQLCNFNNSPVHTIGVRTPIAKLGVYAGWVPDTTDIAPSTLIL